MSVSSTETWNKALSGLILTRTASYSNFTILPAVNCDEYSFVIDEMLDSEAAMADTLTKLLPDVRRSVTKNFKRFTNRIITDTTNWNSGTTAVTVHDLVVYDLDDAFDDSYADRNEALRFQLIVRSADICVLDVESVVQHVDIVPESVYVGTVPELVKVMLSCQNHDIVIVCLRPGQSKMLQQMVFCLSGLLTEAFVDTTGNITQRSVTIYAVGGSEKWICGQPSHEDDPTSNGLYLGIIDTPNVKLKQPGLTVMGWQDAQCDSVEIVCQGLYLGIEVSSSELTNLYRSIGLSRSPNNYSVLIHDSVSSYVSGSTSKPEVYHLLWHTDAMVAGHNNTISPELDPMYLKTKLLEYGKVVGLDLFITARVQEVQCRANDCHAGRLLAFTVPNVHYDKAMMRMITDLTESAVEHWHSGSDKVKVKVSVLSDPSQLAGLDGVLCEKADVFSVAFVDATGILHIQGPAAACVKHLLLLKQTPILSATTKDSVAYAANVCNLLGQSRVDCPFGTMVIPVFVLSNERTLQCFMDEIDELGAYVTTAAYNNAGAHLSCPRIVDTAVLDVINEALQMMPRLERYLCFRDPRANTYEWHHLEKYNIHPAMVMLMLMMAHRLYEPQSHCFTYLLEVASYAIRMCEFPPCV